MSLLRGERHPRAGQVWQGGSLGPQPPGAMQSPRKRSSRQPTKAIDPTVAWFSNLPQVRAASRATAAALTIPPKTQHRRPPYGPAALAGGLPAGAGPSAPASAERGIEFSRPENSACFENVGSFRICRWRGIAVAGAARHRPAFTAGFEDGPTLAAMKFGANLVGLAVADGTPRG